MTRQSIATYSQAVEYLLSVPRFTTKNTPEDTKAHLHRLGDPDRKLKVIHVAGTNGKGSVCAYLRSILEAAGYKVAVFTSPHLTDIRERFLIRGQIVEEEAFLKAFLQVYDSLDWKELEAGKGYHPTFFEYLFFMAMLLFADADVDYCILETGLGGRLDATNAVAKKELCVITRIGLDHVEYLGDTIAAIAGEKAGIMKPDTPAVCLDAGKESSAVFREMADKLQIPVYFLSKKDYAFSNFHHKNIDFSVHTEYYGYIRLELHTHALYQMENAALAVLAVCVLDKGLTVTASHIRKGLKSCVWQGRMEEVLPGVYVDGAHNEDGIRAFLDTVEADGAARRKLLFSVVQDKDYEHMIERIVRSGLFSEVAIAHMRTARAADLQKLRALFEKDVQEGFHCTYTMYDNVEPALRKLLDTRGEDEIIYIAGSLYLAGEIKTILKDRKA